MATKAEYKDKEWLREQYKEKRMSMRDIADKIGCHHQTIRNWIHKFNIPTFNGQEINRQRVEVTCEECGQSFEVKKYRANQERNFCSQDCFLDWLHDYMSGEDSPMAKEKITQKCDYCGEKFKKAPSLTNRYEHEFCSMECKGKWQSERYSGENAPRYKGGYNEYLRKRYKAEGGWRINRRRAIKRDKNTCQFCGKKADGKDHDVHHIKPVREGGANHIGNLITLCKSCHLEVENA